MGASAGSGSAGTVTSLVARSKHATPASSSGAVLPGGDAQQDLFASDIISTATGSAPGGERSGWHNVLQPSGPGDGRPGLTMPDSLLHANNRSPASKRKKKEPSGPSKKMKKGSP